MKNIRSISIAALSLMLLLSTTASHGMFNSIASALKGISFKGAQQQAIETIKAHPYISATITATPFVGYGLYKAGKYAFGKKAITASEQTTVKQIEKPSTEESGNKLNKAITVNEAHLVSTGQASSKAEAKNIVAQANQSEIALLAKEAKIRKTVIEQVDRVFTTVRGISRENAELRGKSVDKAQFAKIERDLEPLAQSIKELRDSNFKTEATNFVGAVGRQFSNTNDLTPVISAEKALKEALISEGKANATTAKEIVAQAKKSETALLEKEAANVVANAQKAENANDKAIIAQFEKVISDQLNDMHVHVIEPAKDHETEIDQRRAQVARARAFIKLATTLIADLKKLSDSDKNTAIKEAAIKLIFALIEFDKAGNDIALSNVEKAVDEMKTLGLSFNYKPASTQPTFSTQSTLMQKVAAKLPTKNQTLIGAAVIATPVVSYYAYKNGYVTSAINAINNNSYVAKAINAGSSLLGSVKNFAGFGKKAIA